jgi:hypothetical protein
MRTVRDARGVTWICLELPVIPDTLGRDASTRPDDAVAIECNSGAERVQLLVPNGWDESLSDAALTETIRAAMR